GYFSTAPDGAGHGCGSSGPEKSETKPAGRVTLRSPQTAALGQQKPQRSYMQGLERPGRAISILMADDDEDDRELTRDALQNVQLVDEMNFVSDGQDLIDYLRHDGPYA